MEKKEFTVLYVDDEKQNLISFKASFRRDYKVITAISGVEALETMQKEKVHLLITDQRMPRMTGTELLEKTIKEYPDTIRMVITGYSDIEAIIDAINKGQVFRYVIKPWDESELRMTINNAFQLYTAQFEYKKLFQELQDKVIERTAEIEQKKEEIEAQRDDLEQLNEELKLQKEEIIKQNEFLEQAYNTIEVKNRNITSSIQYAQRIQETILPTDKQIKKFFPESFIFYKPKDIVSGDFYWFRRKEEEIFFAAVDCTGHGVPGAFMSIVGNNMLNQSLDRNGFNKPSEVMNDLSEKIRTSLRESEERFGVKDGMDLALCSFNISDKKLQYSGAFNPLFIIREGEILETKADNFPVGEPFGYEFAGYKNHTIQMQTGDVVYTFSDGYIDQFGGHNLRKFMKKRFRNLLLDIYKKPLEQQQKELEEVFDDWKGDTDQIDDVLIIGIKIQ